MEDAAESSSSESDDEMRVDSLVRVIEVEDKNSGLKLNDFGVITVAGLLAGGKPKHIVQMHDKSTGKRDHGNVVWISEHCLRKVAKKSKDE